MVVLPVPPFPLTMCRVCRRAHEMPETAMPAWVLYRRLMAMRLAASASTWPALRSRPA